jgi:hypothetical protein
MNLAKKVLPREGKTHLIRYVAQSIFGKDDWVNFEDASKILFECGSSFVKLDNYLLFKSMFLFKVTCKKCKRIANKKYEVIDI